ncbi:hypothetical protein A2U01_0029404, partial [Trifolium medium]|nr:hypothetical protein [Trifolium medium]
MKVELSFIAQLASQEAYKERPKVNIYPILLASSPKRSEREPSQKILSSTRHDFAQVTKKRT